MTFVEYYLLIQFVLNLLPSLNMEEDQKNHIRKNLPGLIVNTKCDGIFVETLSACELLSFSDVATLDSINNELEKTRTFYKIIITRANSYELLRKALHKTKQTGALQILNELSGVQLSLPELETRIRKRIRFGVLSPAQHFTGREAELTTLHENLTKSQSATAVVSGLGGIGKTELCRRYIEKHSEEYDGNVIWIGAEKKDNLVNDFHILAKDQLHISLKDVDGGEKYINTIVDEVYNYFSQKKCLFIFDNAVSDDSDLFDIFMPSRVETKPPIIITSRDKEWLDAFILNVEEMDEADAIQFVKNCLNIKSEIEDASIKLLVLRLQRFPLALRQSISFIKQQRISKNFEIGEYLELFEKNSEKMLNTKISTSMANRYTKTTFTTWKITTNTIAADEDYGSIAIEMLNLLAYLEPDKIPLELVLRLKYVEKEKMFSSLHLLVKYSMINSQPILSMFSVHRLVQEVTRIELKIVDKEKNVLKKCLLVFTTAFCRQEGLGEKLVAHAIAVFDYAKNYKMLVVEFSYFPNVILLELMKSLQITAARLYGIRSLHVLSGHLEAQHFDILEMENLLASCQETDDRIILQLQQVLKKYESLDLKTKEQKFQILGIKYRMASSLLLLSKVQEAFKLMIEIFCEQTKVDSVYGVKRDTSNPNYSPNEMVAIIKTMFQSFKLTEGIGSCWIFELANGIAKYFILSRGHLPALEIMNTLKLFGDRTGIDVKRKYEILQNIALTYEVAGDHGKAIVMLEQAFMDATPFFETHPDLTKIGMHLGRMLNNRGKYSKAIDVASKVYEVTKNKVGQHHPDTYTSLHMLNTYKRQAGDLNGTAEMIENAHSNLLKLVGNKNMITLSAKTDLAQVMVQSGKYFKALNLQREMYEMYLTYFGPHHVECLAVLLKMILTLVKMNAYWSSWTLCTELEIIVIKICMLSKKEQDSLKRQLLLMMTKLNSLTDSNYISDKFQTFKCETSRRCSFLQPPGWKIPFITAEECAEAGFFFLRVGAKVQCVFCGGTIEEWVVGRAATVEHKKRFPWCPFVMGLPVGNVSLSLEKNDSLSSTDEDFSDPVGTENQKNIFETSTDSSGTKKGELNLADIEFRLKTFKNWPSNSEIDAKLLVCAGFYYIGNYENITCFSCGFTSIKKWKATDDPLAEHVVASPNCDYAKTLIKSMTRNCL